MILEQFLSRFDCVSAFWRKNCRSMSVNNGGGKTRSKKYKVVPKDLKQPRQAQLNLLAQRANNDKKANNGKLPRNYYDSIMMMPVATITVPFQITKEDVRNELRKLEKNAAKDA